MKRASGGAVRIAEDSPADTRLLAIAADQLKEFGPKHITVVGIADAAGMTHANVYRYFANKAALIDAVAGQWLRRMEGTIADIADSPDPADDKLERLIQAWARIHRDLLKADRHLFDVYCTATETARPLIRKHRSRMRLLIERVLDEGIVTGKFDPRDREKAHAFISDAVYRFINPLTVRLDADVPQDILDQRLATMIRAILRTLANGSV